MRATLKSIAKSINCVTKESAFLYIAFRVSQSSKESLSFIETERVEAKQSKLSKKGVDIACLSEVQC